MLVPVLRPLSLGEVLDTAFGVYRRIFGPLLLVSLATQAIPAIIAIYVESAGGAVAQPALYFLSIGLTLVLGAVGTAASTFLVAETYLGESLTTQDAFLRSTPFMGRLIGATIMVWVLIFLGLLLLIVPGLILASGLLLATPALVLEDIPSAPAAIGRSWELTRGYRLKVFTALAVAVMLMLVPGIALLAMIGGSAATGEAGTGLVAATLVALIAQAIFQILVYPFYYVVTTVLYYDLRVRKEGFDLERLASALQQG